MPLYEFKCEGCGETAERRIHAGTAPPRTCSCGGDLRRLFSLFAMKVYTVDRSNFQDIAPRNADGQPMTLAEVQRAKGFSRYTPGEETRERARHAAQAEKHDALLLKRAKREALEEIRMKTTARVS